MTVMLQCTHLNFKINNQHICAINSLIISDHWYKVSFVAEIHSPRMGLVKLICMKGGTSAVTAAVPPVA